MSCNLTRWSLFIDGVQLHQGYSHFEEAVYFLPLSFQKFILSSSERWSHPVVLNTGPLDWKSSALIAAYFTQSEFAPILQDFHLRNALFHQHSVPIHTDFIPQSEKRQTNLYNIQKTGSNWGLNQRLCGDDWTLHRCIVIS